MTEKTLSESLFEQFCDTNGLKWSPIPAGGSGKRPDYRIECDGHTVIVEVEELGLSPDDRLRLKQLKSTGTTGVFDPRLDRRVGEKINHGVKQLRPVVKGRFPAIIVLYDNGIILPLDSNEIRLAMYGQDIVQIGLIGDATNPVAFSRHRFGPKQKVSTKLNTTLSAVALLTCELDQSLQLAIYHNKFAAIPFDPNWLRISSVTHYRLANYLETGGLREWESI